MYEIIKEPWLEENPHPYYNSILVKREFDIGRARLFVCLYQEDPDRLRLDVGNWTYKRNKLIQIKVE